MTSLMELLKTFFHLRHLQIIADSHPSHSRSIRNAFNASAVYVESVLRGSEICEPYRQHFKAPFWKNAKPAKLNLGMEEFKEIGSNLVFDRDFTIMRFGGKSVNYNSVPLIELKQSTLLNGSIDKSVAGSVIYVPRNLNNSALPYEIALAAENAGALGVIFQTSNTISLSNVRVRKADWSVGDPLIKIPVLSVTFVLGNIINAATKNSNVTLSMETFTVLEVVDTFNVVCQVPGKSDKAKSVVVGAHLDSVEEGAGLNDNGSGSSMLLAIAQALKESNYQPTNALTFGWWSAEELGLLGSREFVRVTKNKKDLKKLLLNLNFDMMASPNYSHSTYDPSTAPESVRRGCALISTTFMKTFVRNNWPFTLRQMDGRSDYHAFVTEGIPAGGLVSGAEVVKDGTERDKIGGMAEVSYDPCYHQYCDTLPNISEESLKRMTTLAYDAIFNFASDAKLEKKLNA